MHFVLIIDLADGTKRYLSLRGDVFQYPGTSIYTDDRILDIGEAADGASWGRSFENPNVQVKLDDSNGYFSAWFSDPVNKFVLGRKAEVWAYIPERVESLESIFSGVIEEMPASPAGVMTLRLGVKAALEEVLNRRIDKTLFPNCPDSQVGQWGQSVWGICDQAQGGRDGGDPALRARRVSAVPDADGLHLYLAAWNHISDRTFDPEIRDGLRLVRSPSSYKGLILWSPTYKTKLLVSNAPDGNCYFRMKWWEDEVVFDCVNLLPGGPGSPLHLNNPVYYLTQICQRFGTQLTWAQYSALRAVWSYYNLDCMPIVINDGLTQQDLVKRLGDSYACWISLGGGWGSSTVSKFLFADWVATADEWWQSNKWVLPSDPSVFENFEQWVEGPITQRLQVNAWFNWAWGYYNKEINLQSDQAWRGGDDAVNMEYLRDTTDYPTVVNDTAKRLLDSTKQPRFWCSFSLPFNTYPIRVFDALDVPMMPFGHFAGSRRLLIVFRRTVNPMTGMVRLYCVDSTALAQNK